jgi:hypothetical protein
MENPRTSTLLWVVHYPYHDANVVALLEGFTLEDITLVGLFEKSLVLSFF